MGNPEIKINDLATAYTSYANHGKNATPLLIKSISNRLRRAEGQIRGVDQMIHLSKNPRDIISQIKAIKSALSGVENIILENYLDQYSEDRKEDLIKLIKQLR